MDEITDHDFQKQDVVAVNCQDNASAQLRTQISIELTNTAMIN